MPKKRKKKKQPKIKVVYKYEPSADAEERVARAFDMLFEETEKRLNKKMELK